MARRLVLVRHAQAQGHHPGGDHERGLTPAGTAAGTDLGRLLGQRGLHPDHVWVSTAARTLATLTALESGLAEAPASGAPSGTASDTPSGTASGTAAEATVWHEPRLYSGRLDGALGAIRESPEAAQTVWVIGHEPVMSTATWELADPDTLTGSLHERLSSGFPTATAAVLQVETPWADLHPADAQLVALCQGLPG